MAKGNSFVCQQCGFESAKWLGKCPSCNTWASMVEFTAHETKAKKNVEAKAPKFLKDTPFEATNRVKTEIEELDLVLGGGLVPGQVTLVAGEPGVGKSTLLLRLASNLTPSLYVSGEESVGQIKIRAERMAVDARELAFLDETNVDIVLASLAKEIKKTKYRVIVIDSVQTMYTEDLNGVPGSVGQVRESAFRVIEFAKANNVPVILIGHVTKDGTVAGPSTLAHMVDTVLWFEGDKLSSLRILRPVKNRFAGTDEVGIFQMKKSGLVSATESELMFVDSERPKGVAGSVISCVMEGTRPILVEVQALTIPTKLAFPRRVVHGIDPKKVELIIAILTRHCGLSLYERDVFINVVGGIKARDPGIDLAVAFALASSYKNKETPKNTLIVGELGLLGEIREVPGEARRIARAARQGITKSITSKVFKLLNAALKASF